MSKNKEDLKELTEIVKKLPEDERVKLLYIAKGAELVNEAMQKQNCGSAKDTA